MVNIDITQINNKASGDIIKQDILENMKTLSSNIEYNKLILDIISNLKCDKEYSNIYGLTSILDNSNNIILQTFDFFNDTNINILLSNFYLFCYSNMPKIFSVEAILNEGEYFPNILEESKTLSELNKLQFLGQINMNQIYGNNIDNIKKLYFYKTQKEINYILRDKINILCVSEYLYPYEIGLLSRGQTLYSKKFSICAKSQGMYLYNVTCKHQTYFKSVNYFSKYSPEDIFNMYKILKFLKVHKENVDLEKLIDEVYLEKLYINTNSKKFNNNNYKNLRKYRSFRKNKKDLIDSLDNIINRNFNSKLEVSEEITIIDGVFKVKFDNKQTFNKSDILIGNTTIITFDYFDGEYVEFYQCIGYPTRYKETYNVLRNSKISERDKKLKIRDDILDKTQNSLRNSFYRNRLFKKRIIKKNINIKF